MHFSKNSKNLILCPFVPKNTKTIFFSNNQVPSLFKLDNLKLDNQLLLIKSQNIPMSSSGEKLFTNKSIS